MKNILYLFIAALLLVACSDNQKLDRTTALKLIEDNKIYPKVLSYNIFISDPIFAKRVLDAGLEESGLVLVQRTRKLGDVGQPIISFTATAGPYLLPKSDQDKNDGIQRVRMAEEVIEQVTGVQFINDGEIAIVELKTTVKNITPFSKLSTADYSDERIQNIKFVLYDDGWRIDERGDH